MTTGELLLIGTILTALGLFASTLWVARRAEPNKSLSSLSEAFEQLAMRLGQAEEEIDKLKAQIKVTEADAVTWRKRAEDYERQNVLLLTEVAELKAEVERLRQIVEQHDGGVEAVE